ncbi:MAG: NHL repeat-containing protein [Desulfobulbaceae bacterium]|nr:NHL repeat-containing protein [Desulfobulbaceae bacterium]
MMVFFSIHFRKQALLALFSFFLAGLLVVPQAAYPKQDDDDEISPWYVPVKTVSIITEDDQGLPLKFPSYVYFDKTMDEIYVVGGGRITVYGSDYFPRISLGAGRGVGGAAGVYVAGDGRLFVCQGKSEGKPPRLTILNAAFFPQNEIYVHDIPGAENFTPNRVTVGKNGQIYLLGTNFRGALVLDEKGAFLRWLKPVDKLWSPEAEGQENVLPGEESKADVKEEEKQPEKTEIVEETLREAEMRNLPDMLRPKRTFMTEGVAESDGRGPVQLTDVVCDSKGNIFMLSEETSKVYVYSASEEFLFSFGTKGGSTGKLSRPRGIAVDEDRQSIYVVDYMRHTILVYNFSGRFLFEIGGFGRSPRWFNFPSSLALNRQGNVIVADLFNKRVQVLDVEYEAGVTLFGSGSE